MSCAISTANPAIPPKPKTAAISATIKKVKAQPNMVLFSSTVDARKTSIALEMFHAECTTACQRPVITRQNECKKSGCAPPCRSRAADASLPLLNKCLRGGCDAIHNAIGGVGWSLAGHSIDHW